MSNTIWPNNEQIAKMKSAFCDRHLGDGSGRYAVCHVCGLERQCHAFSRICYATEEENEYQCSTYDVIPSEDMVVARVQSMRRALDAAVEALLYLHSMRKSAIYYSTLEDAVERALETIHQESIAN
jgi:hypothetical protein